MYFAPLSPLGWLSVIVFPVCGIRAMAGFLRLDKEFKKSGFKYTVPASGSSFFLYPFVRTRIDSRAADRIWLVLLIDLVLTIVAGLYMSKAIGELPAI